VAWSQSIGCRPIDLAIRFRHAQGVTGRGKLTATAAGIATVFVLGGAAHAGEGKVLRGELDGGGKAKIIVSYETKQGSLVRTTQWRFGPIEVRCDGDRRQRVAAFNVSGGEAVWAKYADRNGFGGGTVSGPFHDPDVKTLVRGDLVTKRKAEGFVRVNGNAVPLKGGGEADCDSGRLHFKATR